MIDLLCNLHEKAGRFVVTLLAMALLGVDMFTPKNLDAGTLGIVVGIYVGGASVVKTAQSVKVTRKR